MNLFKRRNKKSAFTISSSRTSAPCLPVNVVGVDCLSLYVALYTSVAAHGSLLKWVYCCDRLILLSTVYTVKHCMFRASLLSQFAQTIDSSDLYSGGIHSGHLTIERFSLFPLRHFR